MSNWLLGTKNKEYGENQNTHTHKTEEAKGNYEHLISSPLCIPFQIPTSQSFVHRLVFNSKNVCEHFKIGMMKMK